MDFAQTVWSIKANVFWLLNCTWQDACCNVNTFLEDSDNPRKHWPWLIDYICSHPSSRCLFPFPPEIWARSSSGGRLCHAHGYPTCTSENFLYLDGTISITFQPHPPWVRLPSKQTAGSGSSTELCGWSELWASVSQSWPLKHTGSLEAPSLIPVPPKEVLLLFSYFR